MALTPEYIWILILIPLIAFLYASVGHGGASGYIALMYLFSFSESDMKPIALLINLFVAGIAFYHYWRQGYFNFNLFLFFAIGSIPLSFLGGYLQVSPLIYNSLLTVFLIFAIVKLSNIQVFQSDKNRVNFTPISGILIGGAIGFSSGLIGIGGGIILTPIILLLGWAKMKEAAAVSALFIWVNSIAGLSGQFVQGASIPLIAWFMLIVAVVGGFMGSYLGANKFNENIVKKFLLLVLIIACLKLIYSLWQMI